MKVILMLVMVMLPLDTLRCQGWQRQYLDISKPKDIAFADSLNGVITLSPDGPGKAIFFTTDGGLSWHERVGASANSGGRLVYQALSYHSADFLLHGSNSPRKSSDSGLTWPAKGAYGTPKASKIIHSDLALALTAPTPKEIVLRRGEDAGEFWGSIQGTRFEEQHTANSGVVFDSAHTWALFYTGRKDFLRTTSDGGETWSLVTPIDTSGSGRVIYPLAQASLVPGNAVLLGGRMNEDDFLIGPIIGSGSWKTYSEFGGRAYRVQQTAPGEIWAVLGKPWAPDWELHNLAANLTAPPQFKLYADSIAHTTDDGLTWQVDGTTFEGDSIIEMYWVNRDLGFLLTWSEGKSFVYRYSSKASVERNKPAGKMMNLHIAPNPSSERISFVTDLSGAIMLSLLNIEGKPVHEERRDVRSGQTNFLALPESLGAGNYLLMLRQGELLIYQSFVKL